MRLLQAVGEVGSPLDHSSPRRRRVVVQSFESLLEGAEESDWELKKKVVRRVEAESQNLKLRNQVFELLFVVLLSREKPPCVGSGAGRCSHEMWFERGSEQGRWRVVGQRTMVFVRRGGR